MDIFEGIETVNAEMPNGRAYFDEGQFKVQVESVFLHKKRLGGTFLFITETTVLESSNEHIKAGERRNWVVNLNLDSALPRIKSFFGACIGLCSRLQLNEINKRIDKKFYESAVSANTQQGKVLNLNCYNKITKNNKNFLMHEWRATEGRVA